MDLQTMLDNAMIAERAERMKNSPQLTLGELILKLEIIKDKNKDIVLDFSGMKPVNLSSWRGSYRELAINFEKINQSELPELVNHSPQHTVESFLKELKSAVGNTYGGYKGGDFLMGRQTPVWVANYGDSGITGYKKSKEYESVAVVDVKDGKRVKIITKALEY